VRQPARVHERHPPDHGDARPAGGSLPSPPEGRSAHPEAMARRRSAYEWHPHLGRRRHRLRRPRRHHPWRRGLDRQPGTDAMDVHRSHRCARRHHAGEGAGSFTGRGRSPCGRTQGRWRRRDHAFRHGRDARGGGPGHGGRVRRHRVEPTRGPTARAATATRRCSPAVDRSSLAGIASFMVASRSLHERSVRCRRHRLPCRPPSGRPERPVSISSLQETLDHQGYPGRGSHDPRPRIE